MYKLIESLNPISYSDVYNNIVDGLDNCGENVIDKILDAEGELLYNKIREVDTYANIIDALLINTSKYYDIQWLNEFIMEDVLCVFIM